MMLILISPAKTLDFESKAPKCKQSTPDFLEHAAELVQRLQKLSVRQLQDLMTISEGLAKLNHERFRDWSAQPAPENTRPAIYAFRGDVYLGLEAENWKAADRKYAQQNLRILSGLYGVLRPLDAIQPYRLEMGRKLKTRAGKNLYDFWGTQIQDAIQSAAAATGAKAIVNLASQEYIRAARPKQLAPHVITPVFKDLSNGKHKVISFFAKKARGRMADWIIRNKVQTAEQLTEFKEDGYTWQEDKSSKLAPVFQRDLAPETPA